MHRDKSGKPADRQRRKRVVWSILLVCYVGFVFGNSLTPAVESSVQSMSVLELVTGVLSAAGLGNVGVTEHLIRKMAHFGEYTVLGMLLVQWLSLYRLPRVTRWQLHGMMGFLIPFVDETLQLFTEGRSGQISDVWLDCSGVLFGTAVFLGFGLWRKQQGGKQSRRQDGKKAIDGRVRG